MEMVMTRTCLVCAQPLRGRCDKKFCDDYCRNRYNNGRKMRQRQNPLVRTILKTLLKNRDILESVLQEQESERKVSREELLMKGFDFRYGTHVGADQIVSCFDLGWMKEDESCVRILRRN